MARSLVENLEDIRAAEIRRAIAAMQKEEKLPPSIRAEGSKLKEWQDEAERIYRACHQCAKKQQRSPYSEQAVYGRRRREQARWNKEARDES